MLKKESVKSLDSVPYKYFEIAMLTEKNLEDFTTLASASVQVTLSKITDLKARIIMVVDENQHLVGVVSNGDILRWLTNFESPNLAIPISNVMNRDFTFVTEDSTPEEIKFNLQTVKKSQG